MSFHLIFYRLLDSDREPIPDVPAIYFVMPTNENIQRITRVRNHLKIEPDSSFETIFVRD